MTCEALPGKANPGRHRMYGRNKGKGIRFVAAVILIALFGVTFTCSAETVLSLEKLKSAASEYSSSCASTVKSIASGKITRAAVYRLKSGKRFTRKEIKKLGGSKRFFRIYKIKKGGRVYKRINGKSYRDNPNIKLSDLRYLKVLYHDFDGKIRVGEIIVNTKIAKDTLAVFRELYGIKYQIRKMKLIDAYYRKDGNGTEADAASMNDDNTSGFNYRTVAGTSRISMHGYGRAIDVNPFENPWCPGGKLHQNQIKSAEYANRTAGTGTRKPHMIFVDSRITRIFKSHGFRWLGETETRDYQHFEK